MPNDIAACDNTTCSMRGDCARYRMERGDRQTFGSFAPDPIALLLCNYFLSIHMAPWPLRPEEECE